MSQRWQDEEKIRRNKDTEISLLLFLGRMGMLPIKRASLSWLYSSTLRPWGEYQGWEFTHRFSKRIARFLPKNEQMSNSLKKTSNSLICSFLVIDLSDCSRSLISSERCEWICHGRSFLVSDLSDTLTSLIFGERPKRFTDMAHQKRGNEQFAH